LGRNLPYTGRLQPAKKGRSYRALEEWMSKLKAAYNAILIGDQTLSTLIREFGMHFLLMYDLADNYLAVHQAQ
jgi:hypothetical protein